MTPDEAIEKMQQFRTKLIASLPDFSTRAAMDATGLIVHRIQEEGDNAEGSQLGNYTEGPYKKKRQKRGRQVEYVDLTMTRGGAGMFGSTGIVTQVVEPGIVRTKVAGRDEFTQKKLDWNAERYDTDLLKVNDKENQLIFESFQQHVDDLITEVGL